MTQLKSHLKFLPLVLAVVLVIVLCVIFAPDAINAAGGDWTMKANSEIYWVETADSKLTDEALEDQIQLFAKELKEKLELSYDIPISYGPADKAGANDIVLTLDSSAGIATQGYVVAASSTNVVISASDADGLFYGCRDLIKQLMLSSKVTSKTEQAPDVLERGMSLDNGRKYFSVDNIKSLIRELSWANMNCLTMHFSEEMGLGIESKLYPWLNGRDGTLCTQAEITDEMIAANPDFNMYLTQEQVIDIINYAKLYHVQIIPSLDTPGHMNHIVKKFNEQCDKGNFSFTFNDVTYTTTADTDIGNYFHYGSYTPVIVGGSRNTNYSRGIDISNAMAVAFTKSLVQEYATLFYNAGCTTIDIGGDELLGWATACVSTSTASRWKQLDHWKAYAQAQTGNSSAVAYDAFLLYMNDMNDFVRDIGYTSVRMWNDDALRTSDTGWSIANGVVQLDKNIDILYWYPSHNVDVYVNAGYNVINILDGYNYFAMVNAGTYGNYGGDNLVVNGLMLPSAEGIYKKWDPYVFTYTYANGTTMGANISAANQDAVIATALGVWCDLPTKQTQAEVLEELFPRIHAHGAKVWNPITSNSDSYAAFTANWTTLGAAPTGTAADGEIYVVADLTALQAAIATYSTTDLTYRTQATADAYTAAVEAGQAILNQTKPGQEDVDAATAAINAAYAALDYPDPSLLQNAVTYYDESFDSSLYKGETVAIYANAVEQAREFLKQEEGTYTETQLNEMLATVNKAKAGLRLKNEVTGEECFISGDFKAATVYVGKVATINMSVIKDSEIAGFQIYNDLGTETTIFKQTSSTYKSDRDNYCVMFYATEDLVGDRTYYIYAVYADGTLSGDSLELTVTVKN
ncbi:MAG: family 20 glycosylhydrolase [Oscillospiraceae bacterium]|nr:family 20 glycosylhydrolase [Oscillospiraceae bacterium]